MSTTQPPHVPLVYPDQSSWLLLAGIVQILLGCLCGLMGMALTALSVLGGTATAGQVQAANWRTMIPGIVVYFLLAMGWIWLGIGLARARRWAWTLTVVLSWMWLILGVIGFVMFVFLLAPMMQSTMVRDGNAPPEAIMMVIIFTGAVVVFLYIVLPALFLVTCHRRSVAATCRWRDPKERWTDRCPLPVLPLSIICGLSTVSMFSMAAYGWVIPLFGRFLSGPAGAVVIVLFALALAYLAWGMYRLQMPAWWGMLLFVIVGTSNMVITFSLRGLDEMYEKMGVLPADQLETMRKAGLLDAFTHWLPWTGLVGGTAGLCYLLYVRRYFVGRWRESAGMG